MRASRKSPYHWYPHVTPLWVVSGTPDIAGNIRAATAEDVRSIVNRSSHGWPRIDWNHRTTVDPALLAEDERQRDVEHAKNHERYSRRYGEVREIEEAPPVYKVARCAV